MTTDVRNWDICDKICFVQEGICNYYHIKGFTKKKIVEELHFEHCVDT